MTAKDAIKKAIEKANQSVSFRTELMANPLATLRREYPGITFTDDIQLNFDLSDDDLDKISGGAGGGTTDYVMDGETSVNTFGATTTCFRGTGSGSDGTSGSGKGKGSDTGHGLGLLSE